MTIKHLAVTTLALGAAVFAANSNAAEATATSSATVITPIAITAPAHLVFGSFAPGAGGSVTVSTSGARTASGPILSAITAAPAAARFDVAGQDAATYSINIAPTTLSNGAESMTLTTISEFTAGGAVSGNVPTEGGLLTGGVQSIFVGGTLTVAAGQVASVYNGTIVVNVEYN